MPSKRDREHDAQDAMLAYRTGLNVAICKAWIETPIAKSAAAAKAAFMPDSDANSVIVARSEIEAYALARVKHSRGGPWSGRKAANRTDRRVFGHTPRLEWTV